MLALGFAPVGFECAPTRAWHSHRHTSCQSELFRSRCIPMHPATLPCHSGCRGKSQVIDPSCVGHPRVSPAHSLRRPDACGDGGQCRVRCACGCLATSLDKPTIRETPPHTGDSRSACGRAVSETQVHGGIHPFKTVVAAPPVLCP